MRRVHQDRYLRIEISADRGVYHDEIEEGMSRSDQSNRSSLISACCRRVLSGDDDIKLHLQQASNAIGTRERQFFRRADGTITASTHRH